MTATHEIPTSVGTTYEYRTVTVSQHNAALAHDAYASFGWAENSSTPSPSAAGPSVAGDVTFALKRDRHIKNRPMVTELQRKAEVALADIDKLERSKTTKAMIWAFTIGILGAACLAGSIFLFQAASWVLFVLLGVIGLVGWVVPYFVYSALRRDAIARVTPLIDQRYDTIYDACEQAHQLLA